MTLLPPNQELIIVGMSGGVDSSVAAYLLQQQGYRVEGLFMKNWEADDDELYCSSTQDLLDAQAVCDKLNIVLHRVNFSKTYSDRVFSYFLSEYKAGRTPNPDILCNKEIKFAVFLEYAKRLNASKIATGHYARIKKAEGLYQLHQASDQSKDQSYFLYTLNQAQLSQSLFPLGELKKTAVREIARQLGFPNHNKKDSTGICFIGERKFKTFLSGYLPAKPGIIKTTEGETVGQHEGLMYYTLGQRKGIGIGGQRDHSGEPWYVVDKDLEQNVLFVVQGLNHPALFKSSLIATQCDWVAGNPPNLACQVEAKIRYRQTQQLCKLSKQDETHYHVVFDTPQRAITAGQAVVFYNGEQCLGGGIIQCATH